MIIYTSGTTGYPKGVVIGRRAQTNHPLYYHKEMLQTAPGETAYNYLPLFHVTAQGTTMGSFLGEAGWPSIPISMSSASGKGSGTTGR